MCSFFFLKKQLHGCGVQVRILLRAQKDIKKDAVSTKQRLVKD